MQADLKRGTAAFRIRDIGLSVAILASATVSLYPSDRALAACGASSRPAGVHAGVGGGAHVPTRTAATSTGAGGGSGTLGCAGGSSASALRGLPTASSGRVIEPGVQAARAESHARTTARIKSTNASAHLHVRPAHRA